MTWSRDNGGFARVKRLGFALVPEFGGTIHGYCGETLDANLLDLLEWHRKPTTEDMQKAYVGRSRTRRTDHMLLVQPYSPHLFRQGQLPGPTLLMDMLRGSLKTADAQREWKKVEKQKKSGEGKTWLQQMPLPCRNCSTEDDQSTWLPLRSFSTSYSDPKDLWKK